MIGRNIFLNGQQVLIDDFSSNTQTYLGAGYNKQLNIEGSINLINKVNDAAQIYINSVPLSLGSSTFSGLSDVSFTSLTNGQVPVYNSSTSKWNNENVATSFNNIQINGSTATYVNLSQGTSLNSLLQPSFLVLKDSIFSTTLASTGIITPKLNNIVITNNVTPGTLSISGNSQLSITGGEQITFNGNGNAIFQLPSTNGTLADGDNTLTFTNKTINSNNNTITNINNSNIASGASIDYSKLNSLTASRVLISSSVGIVTSSTVSSTDLSNISGGASNFQDQIDDINVTLGFLGDMSTQDSNGVNITGGEIDNTFMYNINVSTAVINTCTISNAHIISGSIDNILPFGAGNFVIAASSPYMLYAQFTTHDLSMTLTDNIGNNLTSLSTYSNATQGLLKIMNVNTSNVISISPTSIFFTSGASSGFLNWSGMNGIHFTSTSSTLSLANASTLATSGANNFLLNTLGNTTATFPSGSYTLISTTETTGNNMIINGDMQIWQRYAGGTASTGTLNNTQVYGADRWKVGGTVSNNTAMTFSQQAGATSGSYLLKCQKNSGTSDNNVIQCQYTLTRDMALGAQGQNVILSYKALCGSDFSSNAKNLTVTIFAITSGTSDVTLDSFPSFPMYYSALQTLTTTLTNYVAVTTAPLPTLLTQMALQFNYNPTNTAGANDYFSITDVQLQVGNIQTAFQRKSFTTELKECLFYYQKSFPYSTTPVNANNRGGSFTFPAAVIAGSTGGLGYITFSKMRAPPTFTLYNAGSSTTGQVYNFTRSNNTTSTTAFYVNDNGVVVTYTAGGTDVLADQMGVHWTADSDL